MNYGKKELRPDEVAWVAEHVPAIVRDAAKKVNEALNVDGNGQDFLDLAEAISKARTSNSKETTKVEPPKETKPSK